eukprot:s749_g12.t2
MSLSAPLPTVHSSIPVVSPAKTSKLFRASDRAPDGATRPVVPAPSGRVKQTIRKHIANLAMASFACRLVLILGTALAELAKEAPLSTSGVSGRRFSGEVLRETPELRFEGRQNDLKALVNSSCDRWIVVTSIFQPSPATRKLGEMTRQGWCYVVVADKNGPEDWHGVEGVIYLTVERQRELHFHIMDHLPWRHFGRKNVGFLFAIANGARVIYDTDDDNRLKEARIPILGEDQVSWPDADSAYWVFLLLLLILCKGIVLISASFGGAGGERDQVLEVSNGDSFRETKVQEAKSSCEESLVSAPIWSQGPSTAETSTNLSHPPQPPFQRFEIFEPHLRRDGDEQSTMALQTMPSTQETFCPILQHVPATLAECHRPALCSRQQEPAAARADGSMAAMESMASSSTVSDPFQLETQSQKRQGLQGRASCVCTTNAANGPYAYYAGHADWSHASHADWSSYDAADANANAYDAIGTNGYALSALCPTTAATSSTTTGHTLESAGSIGVSLPTCVPMPTMTSVNTPEVDPEIRDLVSMMKTRQSELPADMQEKVKRIAVKDGVKSTTELHAAVKAMGDARDNYEAAVLARNQQHANWKKFLADAVQLWQAYAAQFAEQEKKLLEQVSSCKEIFLVAKADLEKAKVHTGEVHIVSDDELGDVDPTMNPATKINETIQGLAQSLDSLHRETQALVVEENMPSKRPRTKSPKNADSMMGDAKPGAHGDDGGEHFG